MTSVPSVTRWTLVVSTDQFDGNESPLEGSRVARTDSVAALAHRRVDAVSPTSDVAPAHGRGEFGPIRPFCARSADVTLLSANRTAHSKDDLIRDARCEVTS